MAELHGLNAPLDDVWLRLDDAAPLPGGKQPLLVSRERLLRDGAALQRDGAALAVSLPPDADIEGIADWLPALAMIELEFPSFADGRAFGQARELRERFGFRGDIRASGEVLRDQLNFMVRCGFNQFELSRETAFSITAALAEIRYAYQPAGLMAGNSPPSAAVAKFDGARQRRSEAQAVAPPGVADARKASNS